MYGVKDSVNSHFFHSWSEASAYVLGFWWADGSIAIPLRESGSRRYSKFEICSADEYHLQDVANLLSYSGKIQRIVRTRSGKESTIWNISFSDSTIVNQVISLGGECRKSFKETVLPPVPDDLFRHFVRGFFDGDGSIFLKHYKNRHGKITEALESSFSSGRETGLFLENFKNKIRTFIPVGNKKIVEGTAKKLTFSQHDTMLLCDWMYDGATTFLQRKRDVYDGFDKNRLRNSHLYFSNRV